MYLATSVTLAYSKQCKSPDSRFDTGRVLYVIALGGVGISWLCSRFVLVCVEDQ